MGNSLSERLNALGLPTTASGLDDLVAFATKQRLSPVQLLEHVADLEEKERTRRSLERRTSRSRLGRFKPMASFDWGWPTRIDRESVESALGLDFMGGRRNVVLIASQGLGKTMIAQNIAHQAILEGHSVLFTTAAQMLLDLGAQESSRSLDNRLKYYAKVGVLVLDELGYLAFDNRNADLLFEVINRRYEQKSLVLTTNLMFRDWPAIFPNATCTTALIDRVIHHADIIVIEGESYRKREAEERSTARRSASAKDPAKSKKS
jgi:DNA replication protein DnaC